LQSQPCFAGCPARWYDYFIQKKGKDTQFSKKGGNMSIDAISSSYQAQSISSIRSDFKNFKLDAKSLQNAISSGNQDQVSISENALAKSLSQVVGDMNGTSGAQSAAGTSGTQPSNPMQTFKADMQTLLNAVSPSAGGQNATASPSTGSAASPGQSVNSALNTVMNDLSTMQGANHGHHHHHGGGSSVSGSQSQNPMQSLLNDLNGLQNSLSSTSGTQSSDIATAASKVLNDISMFTKGQSAGNNSSSGVSLSV